MILYHGSNQGVQEPHLLKIQRDLDFGKGFYTTSDFDQAVSWAYRTARIRGTGAPAETYPTILLYLDGFLDAESAIKRLLTQRLKDQFTFKSQKAVSLLICTEVRAV